MTKLLSDNRSARWAVLLIVSLTMMVGYFLNDAMAPLMTVLQSDMGWTAGDFGFFNSSYSWLNVFCLMLIFGGIILDKMGARFTGTFACALMVIGAVVKYCAIEYLPGPAQNPDGFTFLGHGQQVMVACCGFAIFAMGYEMCGVTVSKVLARWFNGHEMALAMGTQVALCRVGSFAAMFLSPIIVRHWKMSTPLFLSCILLVIAFLAYLFFNVLDSKLDKQLSALNRTDATAADDDSFHLSDLKAIVTSKSFWLIVLFCLLFYSSVKPFNKFSTSFIINKYGFSIDSWFVNFVPSLLHLCSLCLTPVFGWLYDKKGRGSRFLIAGSCILMVSLVLFALPVFQYKWFAVVVMMILGVAYSLVPAVYWPIIPKVIPQKRLGSAYSLIFWIQNIGLSYVPLIIGLVLDRWCITGTKDGAPTYDYTLPMCIFVTLSLLAIYVAMLIRQDDKVHNYGIETANLS